MIIVHGTIPIKADMREQALELARWMEEASRAENGCITYEFFVGLSNPNTLMLFQEWEDAEALAEHFNTSHMEQFLRALPDVLNGQISTRRYAVEVQEDTDAEDEEIEFGEEGDAEFSRAPEEKPVIH